MANPIDDIARQAREGSVASIIQILNDELAQVGVRARAVFADGVLQLLCEAATPQLLEESSLVTRVREILEGISPRNIRRVNINSRLVREHQLLWLEEISRDPDNQLLWSQEIKLRKPNLFKRLAIAHHERQELAGKRALPRMAVPRSMQQPRQFQRGIVGGISLTVLLLGAAAAIHKGLNSQVPKSTQASTQAVATAPSSVAKPALKISKETVNSAVDSFAQAVRVAEQAATEGKTAQSREDWLIVATKWQQASDLMAAVPSKHPRYTTAQNRMALYRENSDKAQQEAQNK
ncbi:hypothetical protein Osc7112_5294 [Oscillatoria nigro-viridis PCC 7112]|uniref:Uncharacterized protein n=1 Tax=Phormidium nigroviride PCC 7112 TaxID=179408 RepID=K9VN88_9CYAN|nr:hypothetical protein [Oscillatoria nigro-viridis]AFZ09533.1 hypothetical protein Osc7112_5294 [Oscillatoria nigro-viridis PCC 7112]